MHKNGRCDETNEKGMHRYGLVEKKCLRNYSISASTTYGLFLENAHVGHLRQIRWGGLTKEDRQRGIDNNQPVYFNFTLSSTPNRKVKDVQHKFCAKLLITACSMFDLQSLTSVFALIKSFFLSFFTGVLVLLVPQCLIAMWDALLISPRGPWENGWEQ